MLDPDKARHHCWDNQQPDTIPECQLYDGGDGLYVCRYCQMGWQSFGDGTWQTFDWNGPFPWEKQRAS